MNKNAIVLYAEDDENDVFFMQRAFAKNKSAHRLRIVHNGREAVDYLARAGAFADDEQFPLPSLVLLDVKMPDMSGLETLQWIRAKPEFDRIAVVMFTSSTQESDVEFSRARGANGYFVKPSNAENLSRLLVDIQRASEALTPNAPRLSLEGNELESARSS